MSEDRAAKKRALDDLSDIAELKKSVPFNRLFMRRVNEELKKRMETVLHDRDLTPDQLYKERLLYLAALDTSQLMEKDEAACRSIIGDGAGD